MAGVLGAAPAGTDGPQARGPRGTASAPPVSTIRAVSHMTSHEVLTARERGVMWQHRILNVAWELKFGVSSSSLMLKLLALSGNDTAVIAQANSVHWAVNGFLQLFGTPLAGALSDSVGRKPLWALGRCSKLIWFMGSLRAESMNAYIVACILAWGVGDLGTLSVQEAAWADVFGDRPELSARLKASNQVWTGIAGLVGPVIGAQLSLHSETIGFWVSSAMCIIEAAMVMTSRESLPEGERKSFAGIVPLIKKANPFASIGLLFTNGPGLRSLGISAGFLRSVRKNPPPWRALLLLPPSYPQCMRPGSHCLLHNRAVPAGTAWVVSAGAIILLRRAVRRELSYHLFCCQATAQALGKSQSL